MKVLILGGTGFVGSYLKTFLTARGDTVVTLGRRAFSSQFDLTAQLNGQDVVINLSGENIGKRWTESYKQALIDSRVKTSDALQQALQRCSNPPKRILAASAIGIYPENDCDHPIDESHDPFSVQDADNFLSTLGQAWEQANAKLTPEPVIMRFGVVLGKKGGALAKMLPPFKLGLGGPVAGGKQCFSWIHIEDLARAVAFLIDNPELTGAFNITAPAPLTNAQFGKALANQLKRPFLIPLPLWQLKLMFGEGAQVLTYSSAILPTRLLDSGFTFQYGSAQQALKEILSC